MVSALSFCIAYVVVDALCLVLTVIMASNVSRDSGSETQVRMFFMLLTANLVFVVFDAVWAILVFSHAFEPSDVLLSVVNGINLTAIAFAAYFWFSFSLAHFMSQVTNSTTLRVLTAIPALLVPAVHAAGFFANQNVIFAPDGSISYGTMHAVNSMVPLLYLLAATFVALHKHRHATTRSVRRMSLVFILFMLAPAAAGVFDMFVPDMPVAAAGIMISIVFVTMAMQEERISSDALTGLNNRRRADTFLEDQILHASATRPLYLFLVDMDLFKSINDTYGHLEGDHALQIMANALRAVSARLNAFVARWGGDEFVLICAKEDPFDPESASRLVQDELVQATNHAGIPYSLACSVGYARCVSPEHSRARLVAEADRMLYRNKQAGRGASDGTTAPNGALFGT